MKRIFLIYGVAILVLALALVGTGAYLYFVKYQASQLAATQNSSEFNKEYKEYQVKDYNIQQLYQEVTSACSDRSYDCLNQQISEVTKTYGPTASLEALRLLFDNGLLSKTTDDHEFAHVVGKDTAKYLGITGAAFLACPTSFNYGCQHGFFQYALKQVKPPRKAIDAICGTLGNEYSSKFKFYCYHGVGHGLMDAMAYDLKASLDVCDTLEGTGTAGCWQGVFMENVNGGMRGEAPKGNFSAADPLVPCNQVADKYRHECYINHAGWLMHALRDGDASITACMNAGNYVDTCLESLGLMVTNPVWQPAWVSSADLQKDNTEIANQICMKFPKNYRESCVVAGVDNILNFDEFNTNRAERFCNIVESDFQNACYYHIGISLRGQATDVNLVSQTCSRFSENFKKECLKGAGLEL